MAHLVDASSRAMRELLRRVAMHQITADEAVDILHDWPNRDAGSSALRAMARRATELRREARAECQGRYIAEQNLRYAPISGIEQYHREVSAAFFAGQQVPPVPWPIAEPKEQ